MEFVNNLNNLIIDDQYFMEVPVVQGPSNVPIGNIGLLGTFSRGVVNTPTLVTSYPDLVKKFGEVDTALTLTGTLEARGIFKQGNANVYVVRVQPSGTPAANAQATVNDSSATPALVMTLKAATPGTWGNSLTATTSTGTKTGTFKIVLQYGSESETWDNVIIAQPATPITGAVLASTIFGANGLSALATATFPATPNTNLPANNTYNFSGGTDGALAAPTDYVGSNTGGVKTGLYALDNAPVNVVLCAGQSDPTVNSAVISNAQTITQNGGLPRIGLISFPKGTQPSGLATLTQTMDTDRGIAVFPWVSIYEPVTNTPQLTVSPLGYFAGVLAQLSPHKSTGNKPVYGIQGVDPNVNLGPSDYATAIQARVNIIGVSTPAGPLGIRTGHTLSQSQDTSPIYVRRMKDYIDQLVFTIGGQFVDAPITTDLMRQVYQSVDNILLPMKSPASAADQMIADYKITCDSTNNPTSSTQQNRLICDCAVKLLNIDRFMIFRTQISPGVVITKSA
jgi:hypothetical protein